MSLNQHLNLIGYNADLERFADIWGDEIEKDNNKYYARKLWAISSHDSRINRIYAIIYECPNQDKAFNELGELADTLEAESMRESPSIAGITQEVLKIFARGLFSYREGWDDDWDTLEDDILNYLANNDIKNWESLEHSKEYPTDSSRFNFIMAVISRRLLDLLWDDLKSQAVPFIDKMAILKAYKDEYEPNISDSEAFGGEWFLFGSLVSCETYGELFEEIADRTNALCLVSYDDNGEAIEGESQAVDYLHYLGDIPSRATVWGCHKFEGVKA